MRKGPHEAFRLSMTDSTRRLYEVAKCSGLKPSVSLARKLTRPRTRRAVWQLNGSFPMLSWYVRDWPSTDCPASDLAARKLPFAKYATRPQSPVDNSETCLSISGKLTFVASSLPRTRNPAALHTAFMASGQRARDPMALVDQRRATDVASLARIVFARGLSRPPRPWRGITAHPRMTRMPQPEY